MAVGIKPTRGERTFNIINVGLLLGLVVVTAYPLLYVVFASLSDPSELVANRGALLRPLGLTLDAYRLVLQNPMIAIGYRNTLFYVVAGTALNISLTCLGAYALSRQNVMLKKPITVLIVFTLFFNGGLIPTYLLVGQTLQMQDTVWALIVPTAINTFNLIILKTAFESVPASLEEAARIDGANDLTILFRIVLPLSLPALAVIILFYAVGHWNAYFNALIYIRSRDLYPLQLVLREILITSNVESMTTSVSSGDTFQIGQTIKYATIVVATLPILVIYPFLQKYFVKGALIGAIKE
ncbi:MAG TPA: carbohydrate ABC transporter permease [Chloroflexota bacterium]|nr:carbohydrate ABC transporter permease [Chloroflexota bacterium]